MADIEKKTTDAEAPAEKAAAKVKAEKPAKSDKTPVGERISSWFRSLKSEMKKVVWANPKTVVHNSIMVIIAIAVVAAVIALLDAMFGLGIDSLSNII